MNTPTNGASFDRRLKSTFENIKLLLQPVKELFFGIRRMTLPWTKCGPTALLLTVLLTCHVDFFIIKKISLASFFVHHPIVYWIYFFVVSTTPFWAWGWYQVYLRSQLIGTLRDVFINANLKNRIGKCPNFISNEALDQQTWKLRLGMNHLPKAEFEKAKPVLETGLQVFIDEMKDTRESGIIEILYSHTPMPSLVTHSNIMAFNNFRFLIGKTRTNEVFGSLEDTPHLLVAGPTKKGKSTFLRQLITTFYLNNHTCQFLLIDLKGGLEFSLFKNLPRVQVIPHVKQAVKELGRVEKILDDRMKLLESINCKDIDAYFLKLQKEGKTNQKELDRYIIVVDEIAEMFLAGDHAEASQIQKARQVLSKVARQGRAVGVHLVASTQRPDSKSLDSQVKMNLTGVLCMPMTNDASSITVLGNGRATDLPPYPGRAIWKDISFMVEVQTPLLTEGEAGVLLQKYRIQESKDSQGDLSLPNPPENLSAKSTDYKPPFAD